MIYYKPGEYEAEVRMIQEKRNYLRFGGIFLISTIVAIGAAVAGRVGGASPESLLSFGIICSIANAGIGSVARRGFIKAQRGLEASR